MTLFKPALLLLCKNKHILIDYKATDIIYVV